MRGHDTTGNAARPATLAGSVRQIAAAVLMMIAAAPELARAQSTGDGASPPASAPITAPAATPSAAVPQPAPPPSAPAAAPAATPGPRLADGVEKLVRSADGLAARIDTLEKTVDRMQARDNELALQIAPIQAVAADAESLRADLAPKLDEVRTQIEKLGPPPADGAPPEAAAIAAERQRLNAAAAEIDGAIKTADLAQVRARQLVGRVQTLRQAIFTRDLMRRSPSPLTPSIWRDLGAALAIAQAQVRAIYADWTSAAHDVWPWVVGLIGSTVAFYLVLKRVIGRTIHARLAVEPGQPPSFLAKTSAAILTGPLRALPATAAGIIAYMGLDALGLVYLQFGSIALAALVAFIGYKLASSLTKAYLRPHQPEWRLLPVGDATALRLTVAVKAIAALYAVDSLLNETARVLYLPLPVSIVLTFLTSMVFAALLVLLARTPMPATIGKETVLRHVRVEVITLPLLAAAAVIVIAALTGYIALARYVAGQVVATGGALLVLVLLYLASRAIARSAPQPAPAPGPLPQPAEPQPEPGAGLTTDQRRIVAKATSVLIDLSLALAAVPVLLLSLGFSLPEVGRLMDRALFGFEVGGVQISLARIAAAAAIFLAILFVTRLAQRWFGETLRGTTHGDQGLANSVATGVGYAGFAIAVLVSVSYAGLDITNLAIVAGALSVGIGFGLQSIVNNFVSGLILLVERPIKVGDWIRVGASEGFVRRISVRSTEIETFDRASVILPNSELITGTVVNMTLRNAIGRLKIPVGVGYDSDPAEVERVLIAAARDCPQVARHPAPFVVFEAFGDSALLFSLRVYLSDVTKSLGAKTQIMTAILKGFRESGIEIPFPQSELNVRGIEGLRDALRALSGDDAMPDRSATASRASDAMSQDTPGLDIVPGPQRVGTRSLK
ncbi:MAG: DUF3772 domain-containing protein [Hyphomicrobiaceae bacterium]|nr:DUF3772 domain-containing protein [Hyphomicrobiaceae bacterium]